jgi:hypothetical protein
MNRGTPLPDRKNPCPGDLLTHALGFYFEGALPEGLDWGGLLAFQFGDYGRDDVRAFGAHARIGYRFDIGWSPRLALAFTCGSGDRDPEDGTHGTFDGLFGSIDRLYGRMNLFAWMNLEDYQAGVEIRPWKKVEFSLEYHYFLLAQEKDAWYSSKGLPARQDPTGRSGRDLGQEVDLIAGWKVRSDLELLVGYSHFFPAGFMERTGPAGGADWAFLQAEYSI